MVIKEYLLHIKDDDEEKKKPSSLFIFFKCLNISIVFWSKHSMALFISTEISNWGFT